MEFAVLKKLLILLAIIVLCVSFWLAFALWSGMYSVYTIPPSKDRPDGATLLVTRDEFEPMFNSPHYITPKQKPAQNPGSIGFSPAARARRPLWIRTIVTLPYIDWAYRKSLEKQPDE